MSTSEFDIINKESKSSLDRLIFEQGLRIKTLFFVPELDLMLVVLNNAKTLTLTISAFPRLRHASLEQLNHWQLESDGVSVSWEDLDEDLSVKGFLQQAAYTIIDSFAH